MILKKVITALLAACVLGMHCMTLPTQVDSQSYQIKLSLEISGRYSAEFSGEPIKALIQMKDSVLFDSIAWHTGKGIITVPDSMFGKRGRQFFAYLNWKTYPLKRDSISKQYVDSIYVSVGGGVLKSNLVTVKVTNLPVVLDSLKMKDTVFSGPDAVWRYSTKDSQKIISFTVFAHDLDGKTATITGTDRLKALNPAMSNTSQFTFAVPSGEYCDTLNFIIADGVGGQVVFMFVMSHMNPDTPPEFDSLVINKQSITGTDKVLNVAFTAFDTLKLKFYAHDQDVGDSVRVLWNAGLASHLKRDSTNTMNATYICSTCKDTVHDTTFLVDSLTIRFLDTKKDTLTKTLFIYKGKINHKPVIVTIRIGDTLLNGSDSLFKISLKGGKEYPLQDSTSDPDNDSVKSSWILKETSRIRVTKSASFYTTPSKITKDTLVLWVSDGRLAATKNVIIDIKNIAPLFDSLKIGTSSFKGLDSIFSYQAFVGDTLNIAVYARDLDPAFDTLKYIWNAGNSAAFMSLAQWRVKYKCPLKTSVDTITSLLVDGSDTLKKYVRVNIRSRAPVIDSLKIDTALFKGSDSVFSYQAFVGDTLNLAVYASDLDPAVHAMKYIWNAGNSASFISLSQSKVKYRCQLKNSVDTISTLIVDGSDSVKTYLRVNIGSRAPVIDSLIIDSVLFKGIQSTFSDTAAAGDTVEFRVFAHDNDHQDQVGFRWKAVNSAQLVAQTTSNKVKYICKGMSYVDTISVTAMDSYSNNATRAVELTIEKK